MQSKKEADTNRDDQNEQLKKKIIEDAFKKTDSKKKKQEVQTIEASNSIPTKEEEYGFVPEEQPQILDRQTVGMHMKNDRQFVTYKTESDYNLISGQKSGESKNNQNKEMTQPPTSTLQTEIRILQEQNENLRKANKRLIEDARELGKAFDKGIEQLKADLSATNAQLETENAALKKEMLELKLKSTNTASAESIQKQKQLEKELESVTNQLLAAKKELDKLKSTFIRHAKRTEENREGIPCV